MRTTETVGCVLGMALSENGHLKLERIARAPQDPNLRMDKTGALKLDPEAVHPLVATVGTDDFWHESPQNSLGSLLILS